MVDVWIFKHSIFPMADPIGFRSPPIERLMVFETKEKAAFEAQKLFKKMWSDWEDNDYSLENFVKDHIISKTTNKLVYGGDTWNLEIRKERVR